MTLTLGVLMLGGCMPPGIEPDELSGSTDGSGSDDETDGGCPPGGCLDVEDTTTDEAPGCADDDNCVMIDLLFVIDNSASMGEEQLALSASFPRLIDNLQALVNFADCGEPLVPNVNIMVTTTDMGHPLCTPSEPDGYEPAAGAPQSEACINRLDDFTGVGSNAPAFPDACTSGCPVAIEPSDPFVHFEGPGAMTTNVPDNDIVGALRCIGPQGINGCGYESPLEAMHQAISPSAAWNQGDKPFLRDGATLVIVIVTDEADCSIRTPEGYAYFTDPMQDSYWEINPDTGTKTHPTSAVCWNAGVDCGAPDGNGAYADCTSIDTGVLHPVSRYVTHLKSTLIEGEDKEVYILAIVGIPPVTSHYPEPPYPANGGGIMDLVYRQWRDGAYPVGDMLPTEDPNATAVTKQFEFGIGPGCTGEDGMGGFTGQAIPPVRIREVCESLNESEKIRCAIESVCDTDDSGSIDVLTGFIQYDHISGSLLPLPCG